MTGTQLTRRRFVQAVGAGTVAAGVTTQAPPRYSPVGRAQAIAPLVIGLGLGASVAVGWALREFEVIGQDDPGSGMTPGALQRHCYEASKARYSNNQSTIVDNHNIVDGIQDNAYIEGKLAAIEKLNDQETMATVDEAAQQAAQDYLATVEKNLLKTWNEFVNEIETLLSRIESHDDLVEADVYPRGDYKLPRDNSTWKGYHCHLNSLSYTLANDDTFDVHRFGAHIRWWSDYGASGTYDHQWWPGGLKGSGMDRNTIGLYVENPQTQTVHKYHDPNPWLDLWDELQAMIDSVLGGLTMWVENVYQDYQSGEIDVDDVITPREQAELYSDDEQYPQAVADLVALNLPTNTDRTARISLSEPDVTLEGTLAVYDGTTVLEVGQTYDPDNFGSVYFTYDVLSGEGVWKHYVEAVDGGRLTFTEEPYAETRYTVETVDDESVELVADDFDRTDDGDFVTDISNDVDKSITQVESVSYTANTDESRYETVLLEQNFTIESIQDSSGNDAGTIEFTNSEPQDDTNYITYEEWEQLKKENEELIEEYEDSKDGGGGALFDDGLPFGLSKEEGAVVVVAIAIGGKLLS